MHKTRRYRYLFLILLIPMLSQASHPPHHPKIHSHNDYWQSVPFYQAYAQQVSSIEADIFHQDGLLLVGHDLEDLDSAYTLKKLYLDPIVEQFIKNGGRVWPDSEQTLILMIDIKSPTEPALSCIIGILHEHRPVFDTSLDPNAIRVVITGNVPKPEDFDNYPPTIFFDGTLDHPYSPDQLERIAMISLPFYKYTRWKGEGAMNESEKIAVQQAINQAHEMNKPIRFWASPDNETAWNTLHQMGVDFINTDNVERCTEFFRKQR